MSGHLTESDHMGVALVSAHKHPVGVDREVEGGELLLLELDELHHLDLPPPDVQEVDAVVCTHREQLTFVHDPHETLDFATTNE